ncbi:MAG: hypothetical protein K0S44_205 [Bacteroidetes bacterium]|jgi:hypothetical protein|nr:hypothetical protein [Bacteroidota bacterium]
MILSILIPTLPDRVHFFAELRDSIINDCPPELLGQIEIVSDHRPRAGLEGGVTTGVKRNDMLMKAKSEYVWQVDDDDKLFPYAISEVINACKTGADVIGINGIMTTDGLNEQGWEIRLGHAYKAEIRDGREYYFRFPNHITPMKREHALKVKFPNKTIFEDYEWACALRDLGVLKTQTVIDKPVYHYRVRSKK